MWSGKWTHQSQMSKSKKKSKLKMKKIETWFSNLGSRLSVSFDYFHSGKNCPWGKSQASESCFLSQSCFSFFLSKYVPLFTYKSTIVFVFLLFLLCIFYNLIFFLPIPMWLFTYNSTIVFVFLLFLLSIFYNLIFFLPIPMSLLHITFPSYAILLFWHCILVFLFDTL